MFAAWSERSEPGSPGRARSAGQERRKRRLLPLLARLEERCLPAVSLLVGPNVNISRQVGNQSEGTIAIDPSQQTASGQVSFALNSNSLTDLLQNWTPNQWLDGSVFISGGTGAGQMRIIRANDATTLQVDQDWQTTPDHTSSYMISGPLGNRLFASANEGHLGLLGAVSLNAGAAWTPRTMATGLSGGDSLMAACCDPQAAFDSFGNLFLTYLTDDEGSIPFQTLSGVSTGGNAANTLNDTNQMLIVNALVGQQVLIVGGTGTGQVRTITANTATQFTVNANWTTNPDATSVYVVTGTAVISTSTGGNAANTLNDTGQVWTLNQWAGLTVRIINGTGSGQTRTITANTASQLTVNANWATVPDNTSLYVIIKPVSGTSTGGNTATTLNDGGQAWTNGEWVDDTVTITAGTGAGQSRLIVANTPTQLTVSGPWGTVPNNTSSYAILSSGADQTGISSGANAAMTFNDTSRTWTPNQWVNPDDQHPYVIRITGGRGEGQTRIITANTSSGLTVGEAWSTVPDASSTYVITGRAVPFRTRGISTGGNAVNTLNDLNQSFTAGSLVNSRVLITGGTGAGQFRTITANNATSLTVGANWATVPDATSSYVVTDGVGTSSGANGANTLNDTSQMRWTANQWFDAQMPFLVQIVSGTGAGQMRRIIANTASQLTVSEAWSTVPDNTSTYRITQPAGSIVAVTSTDDGQTFSVQGTLDTGTVDQPSIAAGSGGVFAEGSVWVSWQDSSGYISTSGAGVAGPGMVGNFSPHAAVPMSFRGGNFGDIKLGPDGQVLVTYQIGSTRFPAAPPAPQAITSATANTLTFPGTPFMGVNLVNETVRVAGQSRQIVANTANTITVSPNWDAIPPAGSGFLIEGPATIYVNQNNVGLGGAFGNRIMVTNSNVPNFFALPAQPSRAVDAEANLGWDVTGNFGAADMATRADNGRVYLVYTDRAVNTVDTNIFVRTSDDSGATWSAPQLVHQPNANSQFLPNVAVDPNTGVVAVSWYDAALSPANNTAQIWGTASIDGGASFIPDVPIGAALSNAATSMNQGNDFGDYTTVTFFNGSFYSIWADNSNSTGNNPNGALHQLNMYTAQMKVLNPAPVTTTPPPAPTGTGSASSSPVGSLPARPLPPVVEPVPPAQSLPPVVSLVGEGAPATVIGTPHPAGPPAGPHSKAASRARTLAAPRPRHQKVSVSGSLPRKTVTPLGRHARGAGKRNAPRTGHAVQAAAFTGSTPTSAFAYHSARKQTGSLP